MTAKIDNKEVINIIGGGLSGATIASRFRNVVVYEQDKIGGLCRDNKNYQDFVHICHTDNDDIYAFFRNHTTIRNFRIRFLSHVKGEYRPWYPKEITQEVIDNQINGYSKKMWHREIPPEAQARLRTSNDEFFFHEKYEFIPDFTRLFKNLLKDVPIVNVKVKDGYIKSGKIVLTGPIDEYFGYCFGKLPYRGIKSTHIETEIRLKADCVNIPDETIPFTRFVDYGRLGFAGNWIGIETPASADHYPIRNDESRKVFEKYRQLAEKKRVILVGRQATFHYLDMDEVVEQALKLEV